MLLMCSPWIARMLVEDRDIVGMGVDTPSALIINF
jgi:hypothetical protein